MKILCLNIFVLCYLAAAILLLTLSPFDFQAYVPSEFWVIRASLEDVSRNVLLFMPFGMMLHHAFRCTNKKALLGGFLLSLLIECTQLFIEVRTSNLADLVSNSSGALLGAMMYRGLFSAAQNPAFGSTLSPASKVIELPIAFMFISMCWINAMRSITDPAAVWLAVPNAIAGIFLIQSVYTHSKRKQYLTAGCWSVLALLPLVNTSPQTAWIFGFAAPVVIYAASRLPSQLVNKVIIFLIIVEWLVVLVTSHIWTQSAEFHTADPTGGIFRVAELMFLAAISLPLLTLTGATKVVTNNHQ